MQLILKPLLPAHWSYVEKIYWEGIKSGVATFETSPPSWEDWNRSHLQHSRFVAMSKKQLVGWAAVSPVSDRCVYGGVAEISVYVSSSVRRKGVGKALLNQVISSSEKNGIWTLTAGMFPANKSSIALHESCGFRKIGIRERIGKLDGEWKDTVLFERRSPVIN